MKKLFFIALLFTAVSSSLFSQVKAHAVGIRLGGGDAMGAELSYQHGLSSDKRIEADLGFVSNTVYSRFRITGLYQWVWNIQGGLNWYAGAGAGIGHSSALDNSGSSKFLLDINGDLGIEYHFDVPLQLSLDLRPAFGTSGADATSLAFSARYTF